jgi:hypothetical protein
MNKPEILGLEVLTPDGRGSIMSLHGRGVTVSLNSMKMNQTMFGRDQGNGGLHRFYPYPLVEIVKGRFNFIAEPYSTIPFDEIPKKAEILTCSSCGKTGSDVKLISFINKPSCEPCFKQFKDWLEAGKQ